MNTMAGKMLRIYLTEAARAEGRPLADLLVERALHRGVAGATVLAGIGGYGHHHQLHTARLLELAHDLPRVVELVDTPEHIASFMEQESELLTGTVMTLLDVELIREAEA